MTAAVSQVPAKALEGVQEDVGRKIVFPLQQMNLLQCDSHCRPILRTLAAGKPCTVHRPTDLHQFKHSR